MTRKKKSSHVPEHYLGFSLQPTLLLSRLLDGEPGMVASLEVFEDVGLESANGKRTAIQAKSALVSNPVSDRAVELWKAFGNWIESVRIGELNPHSTVFEIYVSTPKTGDIVRSFSAAKTEDEALIALKDAKKKLWGEAPHYPLQSEISTTLKPYLDVVFQENEVLVSKVIKGFILTNGSGSPQTDLRQKLLTKFITSDLIEDALIWSLGWVKRRTDLLLEQRKPAYINWNDFHQEITSWNRMADRRTILHSFGVRPNKEELERDIKNSRTYIRQLDLVSCDYEDKLQAVNDYMMAAFDRTKWAELGLVHSASFNEFEDGLIRTWKNSKKQIMFANPKNDNVSIGTMLYYNCVSHNQILEGLHVPNHFTPGSFHELSDKLVIGWHPNYLDELQQSQILNQVGNNDE